MRNALTGSKTLRRAALRLVWCIGTACATLMGQATVTESWQINESRPLEKAADLLELKYGVQINYEDPIYKFAGDWQDRSVVPNANWLVLRPGALAWSNAVLMPTHTLADPSGVIQNLINMHNRSGFPGVFTMINQPGVYFIVPAQVRNTEGKLSVTTSVMEKPITLPHADRSGLQSLKQFCDALSQASGVKVALASGPTNYLVQTHVDSGASGETAREALLRVFGGLQWSDPRIAAIARTRKLVYRMVYSTEMKEYLLQVHIVTVEVARPSGGFVRRFAEN